MMMHTRGILEGKLVTQRAEQWEKQRSQSDPATNATVPGLPFAYVWQNTQPLCVLQRIDIGLVWVISQALLLQLQMVREQTAFEHR